MSEVELPILPRTRLSRDERIEILKDGLRKGLKFEAIAKQALCSYRTVKYDFQWFKTHGFHDWLVTQFFVLYDLQTQKEDTGLAFREICDLIKRFMPQQIQVEGSHKVTIKCVLENPSQNINSNFIQPNGKSSQRVQDLQSLPVEEDSAKQI